MIKKHILVEKDRIMHQIKLSIPHDLINKNNSTLS